MVARKNRIANRARTRKVVANLSYPIGVGIGLRMISRRLLVCLLVMRYVSTGAPNGTFNTRSWISLPEAASQGEDFVAISSYARGS